MRNFFEKITDSIGKGVKAVSSKSKELIEITKLKNEIKNVQNSIESRFQVLGKKVFEMLNMGVLKEDELKAECKEITSLFRKITELEGAIKKIELEALRERYGADIVMCPKCGAPNKANAKFCMSCGCAMMVEAIVKGKTCPTCNALVKEEVKFCARCGTKIK